MNKQFLEIHHVINLIYSEKKNVFYYLFYQNEKCFSNNRFIASTTKVKNF